MRSLHYKDEDNWGLEQWIFKSQHISFTGNVNTCLSPTLPSYQTGWVRISKVRVHSGNCISNEPDQWFPQSFKLRTFGLNCLLAEDRVQSQSQAKSHGPWILNQTSLNYANIIFLFSKPQVDLYVGPLVLY